MNRMDNFLEKNVIRPNWLREKIETLNKSIIIKYSKSQIKNLLNKMAP